MAHVTKDTVYLSRVAYSASSVTFPGQEESGDLFTITELPDKVVIGVVDGMGHGHEAAVAAKMAVETLEANAELSCINLVRVCHEKLKNTRGVVMALASINYTDDTVTWLSIGNVEGVVLRTYPEAKPAYESIFMCRGVVGYRISQLYAAILPISKGDILILTTDGISNDYFLHLGSDSQHNFLQPSHKSRAKNNLENDSLVNVDEQFISINPFHSEDSFLFQKRPMIFSPQKVSEFIANHFVKGSDDALVAAVKYLGKESTE